MSLSPIGVNLDFLALKRYWNRVGVSNATPSFGGCVAEALLRCNEAEAFGLERHKEVWPKQKIGQQNLSQSEREINSVGQLKH